MVAGGPWSSGTFRSTLSAALIGIAGAFALIVAALVEERANRIQAATEQAENISRLVSSYVQQAVEKTDMTARDVLEHVRPADMRVKYGQTGARAEELHRMLARKLAAVPEGSVLHLTNAEGDHVYSSLERLPHINIADRYHFTRQKESADAGLVISPPIVSRTTGKWAFAATRRIDFEDGSFAGVVNLVVNLDGLEKFFATVNVGEHGVVNMREGDKLRLMARFPPAQASIGTPVPDHPALPYIRSGLNNGVYQAPGSVDDIMRLYSFRRVDGLGMYVFVGLSAEDYLADWWLHVKVYSLSGLVLTMATLLMVALAWRGVREQQVAQEALAREEEKFHTIADHTYDWEYWQGANQEIVFMSPSCQRVTGYTQADFTADPALLHTIIHPDDRTSMQRHLDDARYADEGTIDFRIVRRDGEIRWIAHGCRAIFGADGRFMGRRASNLDITERKQAEQRLHGAYAYTRSLIEASLDPLVTIGRDGKITDVNAATEAITGRSRQALIGTEFSDYFSDPDKARAGYRQVFSEGRVHDYELEIRHHDGHLTPVLYNAVVYRDDEGAVVGVFAAARNITERKRAEEAARRLNAELESRVAQRTAELEATNKELEEFSYSVSHDMRAPLRAIDGFTGIVLDEHAEALGEDGRRLLTAVRDNAHQMGQLIDDILHFLRMRKRKMAPGVVDVAAAAREAFAELAAALPSAHKARLLMGDLPPAWGDRDMIEEVLDNLLSNAFKFASADRPLVVEVGGTSDPDETSYYVRDNGIGFDMQYANKLFRVFERVHPTGQFEGTAIGLALVKRIVERHGGRVWAEGKVGEGASFHFSLPTGAQHPRA
ncbi:MAG TPA: PAS domain S-box protein [Rhodocyclaceae bacterium]